MDKFIIENSSWLEYLNYAIAALIVILIIFLVLMGFQIYSRYKNKRLKSRNRKSSFATAYEECFAPNAASSAPLKRNIVSSERNFVHIKQEALIPNRIKPEDNSGVLEVYFDYEDEYKI